MTKRKTGDHPDLKMVNPQAAAIDIGSTMHMAAVNPDADIMPVRAFGTFTQDLHDLADWFQSCGVTSVAMESTGVYWIPAFEILEAHGFEVILVNARYAKNVPGRKTDVSDAGWLRQLHSYGLLRGSFRPEAEIATLRAYMRQRERLTEYAAAHIQHMQKALMEMNLQLHHVVSDITGATGMRIIRAIVGGERDPEVLAAFRDIRCKSSMETIKAALVGNDREEGIVEPAFQTPDRPSKLDPYAKQLTAWLVSDQRKSRKEPRTAKLMHADLVKLGYDGSYERVAAFVREWKGERQRAHHTTDLEPRSFPVRPQSE
jgi:hypothetical protein